VENADYAGAYNFIRQRILTGEFAAGLPLRPDELAVEIGLSRTPVRDALKQLEADGLVTIRPRVGASVRVIDLEEYSELAGLRMALEIFAAGLAARYRTDADIQALKAAHTAFSDEVERLVEAGGPNAQLAALTSDVVVREDTRFHLAITTASRNRAIKKEIQRQHLINRVVSASCLPNTAAGRPTPANHTESVSFMRSTIAEHEEIFQSIAKGDIQTARSSMERHLQEDANTVYERLARGQTQVAIA
jgi:DNA-binding GntR family transcriptional regulator